MNDMILILNYSDEFSVEIARRLRVEQIYSRIISGATSAAQVRELAPRGVILSGEAGSAPGIFDAGILELEGLICIDLLQRCTLESKIFR